MLFDPEEVGFMLRQVIPDNIKKLNERTDNFQDLEMWRSLTVNVAEQLKRTYGKNLIVPMTIYNKEYFEHILGGFKKIDEQSFHFCLTATKETIHQTTAASSTRKNDHEVAGNRRRERVRRGARRASAPPSIASDPLMVGLKRAWRLLTLEANRRRLRDLRLVLDREVRLRLVAEHHGGEVGREAAHGHVVVLHRRDVAVARHRDPVLRALELRLQVAEVLIRLQLGVALDDDHEPRQRARELALRRLELLERLRVVDELGRRLDAVRLSARASVTPSSTSRSCCAKPFTVSTRFGIRSARRWYWFTTSDHAALTCSSWL